jgi:O-methyltransferase
MDAAYLYLDLLKQVLTRNGFDENVPLTGTGWKRHVIRPAQRLVGSRGVQLTAHRPASTLERQRAEGTYWPTDAETMIGLKRLDNLQMCIETSIADGTPGDLIETGVWRGGATIFMRAVLAAHGVTDRTVWVADSFHGLPKPDADRYPADEGDTVWTAQHLAISADEVRANFERYHLLDDQVSFLEGWFADTLPTAPIERLAVARLDGDMYGSTWDAITVLYPKLSVGGFLIVDDYYALDGCRRAIDDYREREGISDPIEVIDWTGVYWRRS